MLPPNPSTLCNSNTAEPDDSIRIMVLEADVAPGQPVGLVVDDGLAVHFHLDARTVAVDSDVVPFARWLAHVLRGGDDVVKRASGGLFRLAAVVVEDLHFVPGEGGVLFQRGAD